MVVGVVLGTFVLPQGDQAAKLLTHQRPQGAISVLQTRKLPVPKVVS